MRPKLHRRTGRFSSQMRVRLLTGLLLTLLGPGQVSYAQKPHLLIRTNVLTLPQPHLAGELEFQPLPHAGIIIGASTRDGLPNPDFLRWFRWGKSGDECQFETYSVLTGVAYSRPLRARWEFGGKLLYQYARSRVIGEPCFAPFPIAPYAELIFPVKTYSLNLLPAFRYFPTRRLFLEAALGIAAARSEFSNGKMGGWYWDSPGQLNVGIRL